MIKILVCGLGNIGCRHIEAVCKLNTKIKLYVFSRYLDSMHKAQELFVSCGRQRENFFIINNLEDFYNNVDVAILSNNSNERYKIFETIVNHKIASNIILEKIIFNKISQFEQAKKLIKDNNLNVWVNHSLRYLKSLPQIKEDLSKIHLNEFEVKGNFGLACNITHWLDFYTCITNDRIKFLNGNKLKEEIFPSKRIGYIEFTGTIEGGSYQSRKISVSDVNGADKGVILKFIQDNKNYIEINLTEKTYTVEKEHTRTKTRIEIEYQSNLSQKYIEDIISTGDCRLPNFIEIYDMNILVIAMFLEKLNLNFNDKCNIT